MPREDWDDYEKWDASRPQLTAADLAQTSESNRKMLHATLRLLQNYTGCNSPFEELVWNLIRHYDYGRIDPEAIDVDVQEFHKNFADMKRDAAAFLKLYPSVFPQQTKKAPQGVETTRGARHPSEYFESAIETFEEMVATAQSLYADQLRDSGLDKFRQAEFLRDLKTNLDQAKGLGYRLIKMDPGQTAESINAREELAERTQDRPERRSGAPLSFTGPPFPSQMEELTPEARA